jgi:hypothetical protein
MFFITQLTRENSRILRKYDVGFEVAITVTMKCTMFLVLSPKEKKSVRSADDSEEHIACSV